MKFILLILLSSFLIQPQAELKNIIVENNKTPKDTIEFSANWDFKGRCEGFCNVYIGRTNTIKKINSFSVKENENIEIFLKCPTKIRLQKGKNYKFIVEHFKLNSCTSQIDTVKNTKRYRLVKEIK